MLELERERNGVSVGMKFGEDEVYCVNMFSLYICKCVELNM